MEGLHPETSIIPDKVAAMNTRLISVATLSLLAASCGVVNSTLHGYHRYSVTSQAMEPTIRRGQTIEARPVSRGKYTPKRREIVVFIMPSESNGSSVPFVKRVIAIGGDLPECYRSLRVPGDPYHRH